MLVRGRIWTTLASLRVLKQSGMCLNVLSGADSPANRVGTSASCSSGEFQTRHIAQPAYASDEDKSSESDIKLESRPITPSTRCGVVLNLDLEALSLAGLYLSISATGTKMCVAKDYFCPAGDVESLQ